MMFKSDEIRLLYKEYPMFCLWAVTKGILFLPRNLAESEDDFKHYDLTSKVYILMKRLHQRYGEIMLMDSDERDAFFEMEMKLVKEEAEQNKKESEQNKR